MSYVFGDDPSTRIQKETILIEKVMKVDGDEGRK